MPLPTQPKRKREGGGVTAFPPSLPLSLSSPVFLPICVSQSNSSFVNAAPPRRALTQPVTFGLASIFSTLCAFRSRRRETSESHLPVCLSLPVICLPLPSSLAVVCLHADTPTQMISRHFLPREVLRLPVFPPS